MNEAGGSRASVAWKWGVLTLVLVSALIDVWAVANWRPALDPARAGTLAVDLGSPDAERWRVIKGFLPPGSPLEAAGARIGDRVRFDRYSDTDFRRALDIYDRIGFTLADAAGARRLVVQPTRHVDFQPASVLTSWITGWALRFIALGVALLLALRRSDNPSMRGLSLALLSVNVFGLYFLPGGSLREFVALAVEPLANSAFTLGFLYFALRFAPAGSGPWGHRAVRRGFGLLCVASLGSTLFQLALRCGWLGSGFELHDSPFGGWRYPERVLCELLSIMAMVWSWRHSSGVERERIAWAGLSLGIGWAVGLAFDLAMGMGIEVPYVYLIWDVTTFLSYSGLAYAIVRHRVFDVGFAVNRALAFSIASAIVVGILGVAKWGTDQLLHFAVVEHSLVIDVAIALGVVLVFHRVQHWVGQRVTHTFFRQWEEAAEHLRAFVARAPHVTDAGVLRTKLLAAVTAYCGPGVGAAFYVRDAGTGSYRRDAALGIEAPEHIDANDDAVVEMRRVHRAVNLADLDTPSRADGLALALPMTVRGQVAAFVLVGAKPQQQLFRSDELALLAASVQSVGLDLESLRVEALERANAAMAHNELQLRVELGELRLVAQAAQLSGAAGT